VSRTVVFISALFAPRPFGAFANLKNVVMGAKSLLPSYSRVPLFQLQNDWCAKEKDRDREMINCLLN
jgi:hypothetical protein